MAAVASNRPPSTTSLTSTSKDAPDLTPNPRGIPAFPFMSSVSEYVSALADVEPTLRRFQEMISKYQFMEVNTQKRAQGLREKIPEMKSTLDTVKFLRKQKAKVLESSDDDITTDSAEIETTFPLADTLFAKATVAPAELEEVYLWLGANVMVAYPLEEAEELLAGKLKTARESLVGAEEDLEFLRVQITTLEVATARVYNWDVMEKRRLKAEGKLADGDGDGDEKEKEEG